MPANPALHRFDNLIVGFDKALRVIAGVATATRPNPAARAPDVNLEAADQRRSAGLMLAQMHYRCDQEAEHVFADYLERRMAQPHFANARSVRNALDRARLRHASRLMGQSDALADDGAYDTALTTITAADLLASRIFLDAKDDP